MLDAGMDLWKLSRHMGHGSQSVNVYAHPDARCPLPSGKFRHEGLGHLTSGGVMETVHPATPVSSSGTGSQTALLTIFKPNPAANTPTVERFDFH